ncbi:MAG: winged helix DNA-binding domain-containing protein [Promethearchaeota archaeon]
MTKLNLEIVNHFVLSKQHLTDRSKIDDISQIAKDLVGLHATLPTTPYLSLFARTRKFTKEQFDKESYIKKNLGKIRFVRKTIYILPRDMVSYGFSATRKMAEVVSEQYSKFLGVDQETYERISLQILEILKGKGMTTKEIKKALDIKLKISSIVNLMCDQGLLIRGPPKKGWKSNIHTYHLFQEYFPNIDIEVNEENAKKFVIKQYIGSFGPVTVNDISWWTGFRKTETKQILEGFQDDLTHVEISHLKGNYILLLSDQKNLNSLSAPKKHFVNFLPALDPYTMGYKDRDRYLSNEYYYHVFDRSGNATSSILLNGEVIGIWDFNENEDPQIKMFLFEEVKKSVLKDIHTSAQKVGKFISEKEVKTKEVDSMTPLTKRTAGGFMSPLKD